MRKGIKAIKCGPEEPNNTGFRVIRPPPLLMAVPKHCGSLRRRGEMPVVRDWPLVSWTEQAPGTDNYSIGLCAFTPTVGQLVTVIGTKKQQALQFSTSVTVLFKLSTLAGPLAAIT